MTNNLTTLIDGLIIYDYILFGSVFAIFLLLTTLGIVLRQKKALAIILILISFIILLLGSTLGYVQMHKFLYKNSVSLVSQKHLTYTKAVVIHGMVKNISKFDFKNCKLTASAYKVSGNFIKDYLFKFNPFKKMSIVENDILKGQEREFKLILEPFTYSKDYNISMGADCR